MRHFSYRAKDGKGKPIKGVLQAENENAAGKMLLDQGLVPDRITEVDEAGLIGKLKKRVSTKDKIIFTRQFATLIGAGLPLSNTLRTLLEQTESKPMKRVIEDILQQIEAGKTLADACAKHPEVFNQVYLSLLQALSQC